jgi:hypothetical protein
MPSKSKAQHNLMAMVAHDPKAAKRLGIPQSVGKEFVSADKGKQFKKGGSIMAIKKVSAKETMGSKTMEKVKTGAPSRDGIAQRGKTKGTQVKMSGNTIGNGPLVHTK